MRSVLVQAVAQQRSSKMDSHPNALSRAERLRGRGAVASLFSEGESGFVFPIKYIYKQGQGQGQDKGQGQGQDKDQSSPTSVLFTTPKRYHKRANKRNLLRRRMKEAYRLQKSLLGESLTGLNIALIYTTKEIHDYQRIASAVERILNQIAERVANNRSEEAAE